MPIRALSRRDFLASSAAFAALALCGRVVAEEDVEVEALRRASRAPGPAEAKIAALAPPTRRAINALPFERGAVPGFSAATHRVHWNHHYLEYLWRWESGERALLADAAALAKAPAPERAALRGRLLVRHEEMREAANMVVLHEVYWRDLWSGRLASAPSAQSVERLVRAADSAGRGWTVAARFADGSGGTLVLPPTHADVPFGAVPEAGIDWQSHAWRLDFATLRDYTEGVLRAMRGDARELLLGAAPGHPSPPMDCMDGMDADGESAFRETVGDLCAECFLVDDVGVAEGLALLAGPEGTAVVAEDMATGLRTPTVLATNEPAGLWRHRPVAKLPGAS